MIEKRLILTGLLFITIGIILGATTSHTLKEMGVEEEKIHSFATATTYLFYNGFGTLALAGIVQFFDFKFFFQYRLILFGTILFSGSIFCRVLLPLIGINVSFLTYMPPIGGMLMILGWGSLAVKYIRTMK